MNPVDLFEANDLSGSGNMTHVQVSLLALVGKAKTKGLQSGVDIQVKYSEKQERNFNDATLKGRPQHHWAADGYQQMCQPNWHGGLQYQVTSL